MTRDRGGMRGWLVKGKALPEEKELETALFALKPGEVSQPLPFKLPATAPQETPLEQWQLVTVVKYFPPHALLFKDNERQIEQLMTNTNSQLADQARRFLNDLVAKAKVEIVNPRYKLLEKEYARRREAAQQMTPMPGGPMTPPSLAPSSRAPAAPRSAEGATKTPAKAK